MAQSLDALVVGAGFGGIYQLKKLLDQGLDTRLIDIAGGVGGTWYHNQYPGAMSDTETYLYRYSWDIPDIEKYPWPKQYSYQPEVLGYLNHVADRWDLRRHMRFNQALTEAHWDDGTGRWIVQTSGAMTFHTRYLVTALGLLSKQNLPDIAGIDTYQGEKYHTGAWPQDVSLKGKKVGVIGSGSTGVQVITEIAKDVGHLVCFQRHPQYSVPSGQGPVPEEHRQRILNDYSQVWREAKDESLFGFGFKEVARPTFSVDEDERREIYETAWKKGGGFRFMFETFGDISLDEAANDEAAAFIKNKIRETVKDPEKARRLLPTQQYARRPLCDAGYYQQFNRDHVDIVNLGECPITRFTPNGILTEDGTEHELDTVIFATGFDAVDGNYTRLAIKGKDGESLKKHWESSGPTSYLGMSVPGFPNMFQILGPNGPFCNIPPAIETQVEFISDIIEASEGSKKSTQPVIESTHGAEEDWTSLCDQASSGSLFRKTDSWIFGSNVPGKKVSVVFYFGGLADYRKRLREIAAAGWKGFQIS